MVPSGGPKWWSQVVVPSGAGGGVCEPLLWLTSNLKHKPMRGEHVLETQYIQALVSASNVLKGGGFRQSRHILAIH